MTLFNVLTKKIINTGTEEKVLWFKAGSIKTTDNGGMYLTMFNQPDTDFYIFEQKPKEEVQENQIQ